MIPPPSDAYAVRVLLADDDASVRSALAELLATEPDIEVVAALPGGGELVELARAEAVDVIVVDLHMPGGGPHLVAALRDAAPASAIICFTGDPAGRDTMLAAGATAYLLKGDPAVDMVSAVRAACPGVPI